jgi:hypothetical protein
MYTLMGGRGRVDPNHCSTPGIFQKGVEGPISKVKLIGHEAHNFDHCKDIQERPARSKISRKVFLQLEVRHVSEEKK